MKQLEVQIMGQNYMLGCPPNSDIRLLEAVKTVDSAMCKIRDAGKVKARDRIAVLAALNLAYQLLEPAPALQEPTTPAVTPNPDTSGAASQVAEIRQNRQNRLAFLVEKLDIALSSRNFAP